MLFLLPRLSYLTLSSGLHRSSGKKKKKKKKKLMIHNWIWLPWIHHLSFSVLSIFASIMKLASWSGAARADRAGVGSLHTNTHLILICHRRGPTRSHCSSAALSRFENAGTTVFLVPLSPKSISLCIYNEINKLVLH